MLSKELHAALAELADALKARKERMAAAESCTGGMIAAACTELAGSSQWFERGFVTYSNEAKSELLAVPETVIDEQGAVSEACAHAMAAGALLKSHAHWSVAVTGIAGPSGGSADKPVGMVCFAWASRDGGVLHVETARFTGDRAAIRAQAVQRAISGLLRELGKPQSA
jgi:nicotinamide-nucleotide amidase